jgi:hypothetical protein
MILRSAPAINTSPAAMALLTEDYAASLAEEQVTPLEVLPGEA